MGRLTAMDFMPDFVGRTLDRGRYHVLDNLGSGAYGKVYRVLDTSASSPKRGIFAVKCLNKPKRGSRGDLLQRREFEHHELVSGHPNIVTFHRSFSDRLYKYVILDYCNGGDLFSAITEKRLFHENGDLIKSAYVQLINAVEHCHNLGVFHRDIKPENVLCSDDGSHILLADFGLSIRSPFSIDFGCGSLHYMSPECIGFHLHPRPYSASFNDTWALGVILTNMITGRNPWRYAAVSDACFAAYLQDNDFLKQALPISEGVNNILKGIFILNASRRIPLPQLRNEVLSLNSFFVHESGSREGCGIQEEVPKPAENAQDGTAPSLIGSNGRSIIFEFDAEKSLQPSTSFDQADNVGESRELDMASAGPLTVPSSASSGSSGQESKGPITPATHAIDVDPPVDIPDIWGEVQRYTEGESRVVGNPQAFVRTSAVKPRRPADILRSAVQRIKLLSRADHQP